MNHHSTAAAAFDLARAVRRGDQEWLQEWLEASLWDGRSWILYSDTDDNTDELSLSSLPTSLPTDNKVYQTSLLHKVLEEASTDALPSMLRLLLRHGADPNLYNEVQDAPLHAAARRPDADITIPMLLRAGANIQARNAAGNTVFHEWVQAYPKSVIATGSSSSSSSSSEDDHVLTRMFLRLLRIDHGNYHNWTVLHFASRSNHVLAYGLIQRYGANIHAVTAAGQTALHVACRYGSVLCVRHLLAAGAFLYVTDKHGRTPFHEAAVGGLLKVTELCQAALRHNNYSLLNWNVSCRYGTTALHNAVSHPSALQIILSKGAPATATDVMGWSAFHYACWIGNVKSMQLLWEKCGDGLLHQKDAKGRTPLHLAAFGLPQAALLLERGHDLAPLRQAWWSVDADVSTADERFLAAGRCLPFVPTTTTSTSTWVTLHWQTQRLVVQWLLTHGAVVLATDNFGNLPLAYTGDVETLHALVQAAMREGLF